MNSADDEINILLPLLFGLTILFIAAILGGIFWILKKNKIISPPKNNESVKVLKAVVLSFAGVLILSEVAGIVIFIVQIIKDFVFK